MKNFPNIEALQNASLEELVQTEDIGIKIAESIKDFFDNKENIDMIEQLKSHGVNLRKTKRHRIVE